MNSEQQAIKQIPWVRINGQSIIADPVQNSLMLLNQSATVIWRAFRSGQSISEISNELMMHFQIDAARAQADVRFMVNHWRKSGLTDKGRFVNKPGKWHKDDNRDGFYPSDKYPLHRFAYQLHTRVISVDYHHESLVEPIHALLKHLAISASDTHSRSHADSHYQVDRNGDYRLLEPGKKLRRFNAIDEFAEVFQWRLVERLYEGVNWLAVLHSAALGTENGQAIVFIAQRGYGKSTLCYLLQNHGLIYLSDDVVPLYYSGELRPVPMCHRFKQGSWKVLKFNNNNHSKIFARGEGQFVKYIYPLTGSIREWARNWPVKAIVYPRYRPDLTDHAVEKISHVESLTHLCSSGSVFGGGIDQAQLESIVEWVGTIPSYTLFYSKVNASLAGDMVKLTS